MAKTLSASPLITIKEDYIDMDLSPRILRENNQIISSLYKERETNQLFYKGNLLPLPLPLQPFSNNNPIEHFKETPPTKRYWPKRLKFFKLTHLGSKIKASRDYLKPLFAKTNNSIHQGNEQCGATFDREKSLEDGAWAGHRKSFSGVIRRRLAGKSSQVSGLSMCSSSDLNRWLEEEKESSIQGAIAYCKKTQREDHLHHHLVPSRKSVSDLGFTSFACAGPRLSLGCENQERGEISRG